MAIVIQFPTTPKRTINEYNTAKIISWVETLIPVWNEYVVLLPMFPCNTIKYSFDRSLIILTTTVVKSQLQSFNPFNEKLLGEGIKSQVFLILNEI